MISSDYFTQTELSSSALQLVLDISITKLKIFQTSLQSPNCNPFKSNDLQNSSNKNEQLQNTLPRRTSYTLSPSNRLYRTMIILKIAKKARSILLNQQAQIIQQCDNIQPATYVESPDNRTIQSCTVFQPSPVEPIANAHINSTTSNMSSDQTRKRTKQDEKFSSNAKRFCDEKFSYRPLVQNRSTIEQKNIYANRREQCEPMLIQRPPETTNLVDLNQSCESMGPAISDDTDMQTLSENYVNKLFEPAGKCPVTYTMEISSSNDLDNKNTNSNHIENFTKEHETDLCRCISSVANDMLSHSPRSLITGII